MNTKIIVVALLVCIFSFLSKAQDQSAYSIWNNGTTAYMGNLDLDACYYTVGVEIDNFQFISSQTSTYNYKTNEISALGVSTVSNDYFYLYVYTGEDWSPTPAIMNFPKDNYLIYSIQSDQTVDQFNYFSTMVISGLSNENPVGTFSVTKLAPTSNNYKVIDVISGQFSSSVYNWGIQTFNVIFTNGSGLFVNVYTQGGQLQSSNKYSIASTPDNYNIASSPYNSVYIPVTNLVYSFVDLVQTYTKVSISDLFKQYPLNNKFYDLGYFSNSAFRSVSTKIYSMAGHTTKQILYFVSSTTNLQQYPTGIVINKFTISFTGNTLSSTLFEYSPINMWTY
ncbi:hypothetical protein ACTA71_001513 [Dictyostelium dimigraforme]